MSKESKLRDSLSGLDTAHFSLTRDAEQQRLPERSSAVLIQSHWRSHHVRRKLSTLKLAALTVQSVYRGHLGRCRSNKVATSVAGLIREKYFHRAATEIQRCWRGYFSRKWFHSYYARKGYLKAVYDKNESLRKQIHKQHAEQKSFFLAEQEDAMRMKFNQTIRGLHHLVSTEVCPGVYNSPFAAVTGGAPAIAGKTIEEHLRGARQGHDLLPSVCASYTGDDAKSYRLSFQNNLPSFADEDSRHLKAEHNLDPHTVKPFLAGGKLPPTLSTSSVRASSPYGHHQEEEKKRAREGQGKMKPFYSATKPCDVFDKI